MYIHILYDVYNINEYIIYIYTTHKYIYIYTDTIIFIFSLYIFYLPVAMAVITELKHIRS